MHPCLCVNEILRLIATYLSDDGPTLYDMIQTCKLFHEAIIDILWEIIPGVQPLLQFIPEHTYTRDRNGDLVCTTTTTLRMR